MSCSIQLNDLIPMTENATQNKGCDVSQASSGRRHTLLAAAGVSDMRQAGVLTLDCFPERLTAPLINEYMRIKGRNLL